MCIPFLVLPRSTLFLLPDTIHGAFSERGLFAEVGVLFAGFLDKGASVCSISVSGRVAVFVKLLC